MAADIPAFMKCMMFSCIIHMFAFSLPSVV
uniref:Uncharacterized protein n=1 Tax=Anguilla anguilla TaxID=7936 RepID=A0A0E9W7T8_ANGAN